MTPDAYMIREQRHNLSGTPMGPGKLLCGKVFMSKETAMAAAERLSNRWRTCTVEPVYAQATIDEDAHDRMLEASFNDTLHD